MGRMAVEIGDISVAFKLTLDFDIETTINDMPTIMEGFTQGLKSIESAMAGKKGRVKVEATIGEVVVTVASCPKEKVVASG